MSGENDDVGLALFGTGFGVWSFFWGFKCLRRKRAIENIPTSTIRGMAMGLVEILGRAGRSRKLTSPLAGEDCVYYRYLVQRYRSRGKSGHWQTIAKGDSSACPFWVDDGTGKVLVFPKYAEMILPLDYEFNTHLSGTLPRKLKNFMDTKGIVYASFFGRHVLKFREWYIGEGEDVYVLGTAKRISQDLSAEHERKMRERLRTLKLNPIKMKEVDSDKDGNISIEEWDRAVSKVEEDLLKEELETSVSEYKPDVAIGRGDIEKLFIISDHSQKDLISGLQLKSVLGIIGGALLSIGAFIYLLFRFNIL